MTTTKRTTPSSSEVSQLDKFKEAARELECDDDQARFDARLCKLVKPRSDKHRDSDAT